MQDERPATGEQTTTTASAAAEKPATAETADAPAPASPAKAPGSASLAPSDRLVFGLLLALSVGGMAVADFSARLGLSYWLVMVPVFALASLYSGWARARKRGESVQGIVLRQSLHWAALAAGVYLVYLLETTGRLNREDAGLVALLLLALTTLLAGVHFDWRLSLLGVVLAVTAGCAALVDEFFWMLLLPVAALGVLAFFWQSRSWQSRSGAKRAASADPKAL